MKLSLRVKQTSKRLSGKKSDQFQDSGHKKYQFVGNTNASDHQLNFIQLF